MDERGGRSPPLFLRSTPAMSTWSMHQGASRGRGNSVWGDEPPDGSVPPPYLTGRCWLRYKGRVDPSSSDNVESLPVRAMFSCAYALFISLPSPTDLWYAYVKPAGALSLCWALALVEPPHGGRGPPEERSDGESREDQLEPLLLSGGVLGFELVPDCTYRSEAGNFGCLLELHMLIPRPQFVSPGDP
jgi:hypothetical protein